MLNSNDIDLNCNYTNRFSSHYSAQASTIHLQRIASSYQDMHYRFLSLTINQIGNQQLKFDELLFSFINE